MAVRILVAPVRYVQGPGALAELGTQLTHFGIQRPLVLISPSAKKAAGPTISTVLAEAGIECAFTDFGGECTRQEIERVKQACLAGNHDAVIACGGGKCIDTGRGAAAAEAFDIDKKEWFPLGAGVHCVNIPTVANNDGPTSAGVVIYNDKHATEARMNARLTPTLVLVDTSIVAKAPVRLLVSGMGDALASFFQVDVCYRTGTPSVVTNALSLRAARALARLNLELLLTYGALAKVEAEAGVAGPGLEAVCEANILVSGLSFANGGISACHAIGTAFDHIGELMEVRQFHGEVVAFGTLCQLVMEESKPEVLREIFGFCKSVGLPTTFEEMTLHDLTDDVLMKVARIAAKTSLMKAMPRSCSSADASGYYYDPQEVFSVIKATDAYGRAFGAADGPGL